MSTFLPPLPGQTLNEYFSSIASPDTDTGRPLPGDTQESYYQRLISGNMTPPRRRLEFPIPHHFFGENLVNYQYRLPQGTRRLIPIVDETAQSYYQRLQDLAAPAQEEMRRVYMLTNPIPNTVNEETPPMTIGQFSRGFPSQSSVASVSRHLNFVEEESTDDLVKKSYETLVKQLYGQPVTIPDHLVLNSLRVPFINIERAGQMLSRQEILKYTIDPLTQPWAGPPGTSNRILTLVNKNGQLYLVKALVRGNEITTPQ